MMSVTRKTAFAAIVYSRLFSSLSNRNQNQFVGVMASVTADFVRITPSEHTQIAPILFLVN